MTGIDEIEFIPVKKILRKKQQFSTSGFFPAAVKPMKQSSEETFPAIIERKKAKEDEIPFHNWTMPPQPQAYIKCYGNDFL